MSEYRGFVFDIDMTAVPNGAEEVGSAALKAAFESLPDDIIAIAATGRSPEFSLPITRALKLRHESVVANGALIIDSQTGEPSWERLLSEEQMEQVLAVCSRYDYPFWMTGDTPNEYSDPSKRDPRATAAAFLISVPKKEANDILHQLVLLKGVRAFLSTAWSGVDGNVDVNIGHFEAMKHNALLELYSRYGIKPEQMIGIGDGINDVELFQVVGYKVAVDNAHPLLKELADEIVPSQEDDGLVVIANRFYQNS